MLLKAHKASLHAMCYEVPNDENGELGLDTDAVELARHKEGVGDYAAAAQLMKTAIDVSMVHTDHFACGRHALEGRRLMKLLQESSDGTLSEDMASLLNYHTCRALFNIMCFKGDGGTDTTGSGAADYNRLYGYDCDAIIAERQAEQDDTLGSITPDNSPVSVLSSSLRNFGTNGCPEWHLRLVATSRSRGYPTTPP